MMELRADVFNEDCISGMRTRLEPGSVTCTITSIPFEELFTYSGKIEDVGNNGSTVDIRSGRFALNMRFFIDALLRVHAPGTIACIHIQQLLSHKIQHGFMGRRDFRGTIIDLFREGGWIYTGEAVVPKDPQALRDGTNVLTPHGWRSIESLDVGDSVIGSNGAQTNVLGVYRHGPRQMYRVRFSDGVSVDCDAEHRWGILKTGRRRETGKQSVLTTQEMLSAGLYMPSGYPRFYLPMITSPVNFDVGSRSLPIAPYTLGCLLGDGTFSARSAVCLVAEHEIVHACELPSEHSWRFRPGTEEADGAVASYSVRSVSGRKNAVLDALRDLGLHGHKAWEKFIPEQYLFADAPSRLEVLRGLLDTDGTVKKNGAIRYVTTSERLARDVAFLVQSLGGVVRTRSEPGGKYLHAGTVRQGRLKWDLGIHLPCDCVPFRLQRKIDRLKKKRRPPVRFIESIEPVDVATCTCIEVDALDHLYVTEHCVLTHNTMAQRLNLHSLQFKTGYARSSTKWAPAPCDFVLIFAKPGDVAVPVRPLKHKTNPTGWLTNDDWIHWAKGTWEDIDQFDIIDGARSRKALNDLRESENEKHVCALQLELIRRCVLLYSNPVSIDPNSLVLDPFAGVGSTAHVCVEQGRHSVGFELKESYHAGALANIKKAREDRGKVERQGMLPWKEDATG